MPRIVMLLAHSAAHPQGNVGDGYDITLALTPEGRLDERAWGEDPEPWRVRRFDGSGRDRQGELIRTENGWAIRYGDRDAEAPLGDFAGRVFRPGEYVTLRPPGGAQRVYRIVEVGGD